MSKAYYWLKLKKDFFDDPKILKIRSVAGGDTYTCIYLKLLLKSLDNDGVIFFDGIEPTIEAEIALKIREQEINVKAAMAIFESLGLLQKGEGEDVRLPEAASLSGKECDSAKRVREFRAKQKEVKALHCNGAVTSGNENVTLELEKELEKEKELETETEEANASTCARACEGEKKPAKRFQKPTLDELIAYKQKANLALTDCEAFFDFYESKGWVVGKNPMKDWQAAMRNWDRTERERGGKCKNNSLSVEDVRRFGGDVSYYIESTRETNAIANQNVANTQNKEPF
ncbi:phage replisome organizer N-terminal domain-containing protein [Campylobacter concisus]|uniref:phage replisome organizer N-terminal domain-containing protein n=1 Tax=Campylobacter concisus TaxID=199 RepID=UPI000CD9C019|nr:phage replisome organizer N-terminal domain-containing protein [Campylobacter concisus]